MIIWILSLAGGSGSAFAQCTTPNTFTGSLRIRNGIGCVPLTVRTTSDLTGVRNVRYIYDYNGRNEAATTTDSTHTYTRPGLYQILQFSEKDGLPLRACGTVMVYDTVPPVFSLSTCRNDVSLTIPNASSYPYDFFLVNWGDGQTDTLRATGPTAAHSYRDNATRQVTVQGSFRYASCGGKTSQTFRPASAAQVPFIREVVRTAPQTLQLTISNAGNVRVRVQQKGPDGLYSAVAPIVDGSSVQVRVGNDTTSISCFRLVLADTCVAATPSGDVCYEPPIKTAEPASAGWFLPDAFTPNGDGVNDRFGVLGTIPAGRFRLTIFDRWGRVVFDTDDAARYWDGTQAGQPAASGIYVYKAEIQETGAPLRRKTGTVLVVR
ncbi:hypothetical protein GCM10023189_59540 [Nibrella saemangeumensis]|uniref:Gliding motility-associated C-terminal domain-containing protein n=1 Tax=Nibrella saemangeumensis TaxID=1084526 RepID=A0ABP8NPQ8_9BACT